jgi:DNA-binding protein H-NS
VYAKGREPAASADASRQSAEGAKADAPAKPDTLPLDLTTLGDDVLGALATAVPREIERRKTQREQAFLASIRETAAALNLPVARVAAALTGRTAPKPRAGGTGTGPRGPLPPKYKNPKNPAEVWTGRGLTPNWLKQHEEAGGKRDDCLINEGGA